MTSPALTFTLQYEPLNRKGEVRLVASLNGTPVYTDKLDITRAKERERFTAVFCKERPGIDAKVLLAKLEEIAAKATKALQEPEPQEPADQDSPYEVTSAGISWRRQSRDSTQVIRLTNFAARITVHIIKDDGQEQQHWLEIEAQLAGKSQRFMIPASQFATMNWPIEQIGPQAVSYAGMGTKDHARVAIQLANPNPVRRTIHTHVGWTKREEGWVYLHAGGAIGENGPVTGIEVDLSGPLQSYRLPSPPDGQERRKAIQASLDLLSIAPDGISVPLFCAIYRAPLATCDFGIHVAGATGVFKSELAALVQQHYGAALDARHLPASWTSTDNALEGQLFAAKDTVTTIDDFAPCGGLFEQNKWHQKADRIFRAQGNNAARGRMRADGTLRPQRPPRGLIFSTGEDIPSGQSLRARVLISEISLGVIKPDVLMRCQSDARSGLYAASMAGYVQYLAGRYDDLHKNLRQDLEQLRGQMQLSKSHGRTPDILANLALGLRYFIAYAKDIGALDDAQADQLWQRAWTALQQVGAKQASYQLAGEPAQRFIELIDSALASGQAHLASREGGVPGLNPQACGWRAKSTGSSLYGGEELSPQGDRIGWIDDNGVYLGREPSYRAAQKMAGGGSDGLAVTPQTLRKRLDEGGYLTREGAKDTLTVRRRIQGTEQPVLWIRPGILACTRSDTSASSEAVNQVAAALTSLEGSSSKAGVKAADGPAPVVAAAGPPPSDGAGSAGQSSPECSTEPVQDRAEASEDPDWRSDCLQLAQECAYPQIEPKGGPTVQQGVDNWQSFVAGATEPDLIRVIIHLRQLVRAAVAPEAPPPEARAKPHQGVTSNT